MNFYEEQSGFSEEKNPGTVYHTGNGFYNPYIEPLWKKEKRLLKNAGNGIGLVSLGYIAISSFAGAIYQILAQLIFPAANIHGSIYLTETVDWLFSTLIYLLSLAIPFGIYMLFLKMPLQVAFPLRKAKTDLTIGGLCLGLGVSVLAAYATQYVQVSLQYFGIGITMPDYSIPVSIPGAVSYVISVVIAPAFIEEMVFHGIIMQSMRRFGDIFALVSSALIFGIFHLNLMQMPYCFIMGLCIGYLVMRSGSLWVGILIHLFNNGVVVAFEFLSPYMSNKVWYIANSAYNLVCVILSVIAIIVLLMKYKDMFRFEPSKSVLAPGKKALYFITSPALLFALAAAFAITLEYVYLI